MRTCRHTPPIRLLQIPLTLACALVGAVASPCEAMEDHRLPLAGEWRFALDPDGVGVEQAWFSKPLDGTIRLPGTTDENHKGIRKDERCVDRLSRVWFWKGPAWYQRTITIPDSWADKRITLFLERTKTTRVWVNDTLCGGDHSLSTPQVFDVTAALTPGEHTLTVLVDNAKMPPVGPSHAVDERTQTNWNGIIGRMELRATDPVWLEDVQVTPNAAAREATIRATLGNITGNPASGTIAVRCRSTNVPVPRSFASRTVGFGNLADRAVIEFTYEPGDEAPLWDEFQPALLELELDLDTTAGDRACRDRHSLRFGMRDFTTFRNRLLVNGRPVFLRGKLDCCFFPLTGYPPMDKEGWRRVFSISKSHGINHYRFHSWCPPAAAFEAADELGIYIQAELPNKRSAFKAPDDDDAAVHNIDRLDVETGPTEVSLYDFGKRESERIFRHFGNSPSFVMYTLGNELGRNEAMFELVDHFQQLDPRRLHAQGSNNMHWNPSLAEGDDFWVTKILTDHDGSPLPLRGGYWVGAKIKGHLDHRPPSTMVDFSRSITGIGVPVIVHENASFEVFPDFREIPKYTGVTRARNLEIFRERLRKAGMLDQAHDFMRASGKLSVICHREDIESALRTPGLGGFQLLDIQDFPGQGTALVGILNVFMESKGLITPEEWRQFCSETVPLLRMEKHTWTRDEIFIGRVQVAHHGPADLPDARVTWSLTAEDGRQIHHGTLASTPIKTGELNEIGMFAVPLSGIDAPARLTLTLAIDGTPFRNDYPLWVYPEAVDTRAPEGVKMARRLDALTRAHLEAGGRVLLLPELDELPQSVGGAFPTGFWSPMFAESAVKRGIEPPAGTEGILCDPGHPALALFPTEFHSHWQWWRLVKHSRPVILDDTPHDYRPTVQVIDNFVRNHKLGLVFETRCGDGRLLVCAIDLPGLREHPEARQLLHSLLRYAGSPDFAPQAELDPKLLETLLPD